MKFHILVADCPWSFSDTLTMSHVKRGAEANYSVMTNQDILDLKVAEVTADDAVLLSWVPSSLLELGLEVMEKWGFRQTQTLPWIKIKQDPFKQLKEDLTSAILNEIKKPNFLKSDLGKTIEQIVDKFDLNQILAFGMGRLFRQTHELLLIGVKGKVYSQLENKSQRSVLFGTNVKHSKKPDELQDRLEVMFPQANKLEIFARRDKSNWTCLGNECPSTLGEDIRDSLARLAKL